MNQGGTAGAASRFGSRGGIDRVSGWTLNLCGLLLATWVAGASLANPQGPRIVHGQVEISRPDPGTLAITSSPNAIVNWQSFSIGATETTRFIQEHAGSAVLNRVTGQDPSSILGHLLSNGRVFLINPNGMVFGSGAVIDTAGFVGSTLDIADEDFLAGRLGFEGGPDAGAIENKGLIRARGDGGVYLIAPSIENSGIIRTESGALLLAAGRKVQLSSLDLDSISVEIQAPEDEAVNLGKLLTAGGALSVFAGTIRNHGVMEANALAVGDDGEIRLVATGDIDVAPSGRVAADGVRGGHVHIESESGTSSVSGVVQARGLEERGGEVMILGERVGLFDSATVDVSGQIGGGSVLIGGDYQGGNPAVKNASVTYVAKDVTISADAGTEGDGGEVIVWADGATRFFGTVSARGGTSSGNGGFVEVSGKRYLDFRGVADLTAGRGEAGTLLLDPTDITISSLSSLLILPTTSLPTSGTDPFIITPEESGANLDVADLSAQLALSNVIVKTESIMPSSELGDIIVAAEITAPPSSNDLTLEADNDIILKSNLDFADSTGTITLNAKSVRVDAETQIFVSRLELGAPVVGSSPLILLPSRLTIELGSDDSDAFLSTSSLAQLRNFEGGLSIGGSIPGVAGATGLASSDSAPLTVGDIIVSTEFRVAGDLALHAFGDVSVQEGGMLGSGRTLTVAAGRGSTDPPMGAISDPGAGGPPFYFEAPEIVLIANGAVGTSENPLTVRSDLTTVSVGSGTGFAFLDGAPGVVLPSGPLIEAIFAATCSPFSCSYSSGVLDTVVVAAAATDTVPPDVAEPEVLGLPSIQEQALEALPLESPQDYNVSRILDLGPQLLPEFNMSRFSAVGLVKADWPILFSYRAPEDGGIQLSVTAEGITPFTFRGEPGAGERRTAVLTVPARFGDSLMPAVFKVLATRGSTDQDSLVEAQVYALGAGPKAIGSEAIEQIRFQPPFVRAGAGQAAAYRFFSRSDFDQVEAEFMRVTPAAPGQKHEYVNRQRIEGGVAENQWIGEKERRVWNGQAETGQLSPGQHRLQVRAWRGAGDWIAAWSDSVVTVAP